MQEKRKILAVDDNSINLAVIEELLGSQYDLMTVSTGPDALKMAQEFRPDLILLDIMMSGMNGYEVCQKIRKSSSLRYTRIIIVSAKAMVSERLKGYQAGADDYLTKPYNADELLAKVRVHLRLKPIKAIQQTEQNLLNTLYNKTNALLNSLIELAETLKSDENIAIDKRKDLAEKLYSCVNELQRFFEQTIPSGSTNIQQVEVWAGQHA